jgi:hypothetical protein
MAKILKYPISTESTGLYLQFAAYDYSKGQATEIKSIRDAVSATSFSGISRDGLLGTGGGSSSSQSSSGLSQSGGSSAALNSSVGSAFLYLPPKMEYSYGATWNKVSFGALGASFGTGNIDLGAIAGTALSTGANTLLQSITNSDAFKNIPKVEGISLDTVVGAAFGVSYNDNTVQTFDRMEMRSFSFDYLMVARNAIEENEIRKIVKFFKLAMHPKSQANGRNNTVFLDYPYVFRILPSGYKSKSGGSSKNLITFLPSTQFCALTKFGVDYAPDNVVNLTPNDFVTAVRLSLSFSELVPLTRQDIESWEDNTDYSL